MSVHSSMIGAPPSAAVLWTNVGDTERNVYAPHVGQVVNEAIEKHNGFYQDVPGARLYSKEAVYFEYDKVYLAGMSYFKDRLHQQGFSKSPLLSMVRNAVLGSVAKVRGQEFQKELYLPWRVRSLSYGENEQLKRTKTGMENLKAGDKDPDLHAPWWNPVKAVRVWRNFRSRNQTEKKLTKYAKIHTYAGELFRSNAKVFSGFLEYDSETGKARPKNLNSVQLKSTLKKEFGVSLSEENVTKLADRGQRVRDFKQAYQQCENELREAEYSPEQIALYKAKQQYENNPNDPALKNAFLNAKKTFEECPPRSELQKKQAFENLERAQAKLESARGNLAGAVEQEKNFFLSLLNGVPFADESLRLATVLVEEEHQQLEELKFSDKEFSIQAGSSFLTAAKAAPSRFDTESPEKPVRKTPEKGRDFVFTQPYGQHDGKPCHYRLSSGANSAGQWKLEILNPDGTEISHEILTPEEKIEHLKKYFSVFDIDLLFAGVKNLEKQSYETLAARLMAKQAMDTLADKLLNRELDLCIQHEIQTKNIQSIQGTGYSYNGALYGENQAVNSRTVVTGRLFEMAKKGKIALHGSCGFQQDLVKHQGGNLVAVQDTTGKTFLRDDHGSDPMTVDEKETYHAVDEDSARFGLYETKRDGKWMERNTRVVHVCVGNDEEERNLEVFFQGKPVSCSSALSSKRLPPLNELNDGHKVELTQTLGDFLKNDLGELVLDENQQPVFVPDPLKDDLGELVLDENQQPVTQKTLIKAEYNAKKRCFEITSLDHWERVPLPRSRQNPQTDNPNAPALANDGANQFERTVLCTYARVRQSLAAGNLDPQVLLNKQYTRINCVHTQNGLASAKEDLGPQVKIVGRSVMANDLPHGRATMLAGNRHNGMTHPVAVSPDAKRQSLILEDVEIQLGAGVVATFNQHHKDMLAHEGGCDKDGNKLAATPFRITRDKTRYPEKALGNRHGNSENLRTGATLSGNRMNFAAIRAYKDGQSVLAKAGKVNFGEKAGQPTKAGKLGPAKKLSPLAQRLVFISDDIKALEKLISISPASQPEGFTRAQKDKFIELNVTNKKQEFIKRLAECVTKEKALSMGRENGFERPRQETLDVLVNKFEREVKLFVYNVKDVIAPPPPLPPTTVSASATSSAPALTTIAESPDETQFEEEAGPESVAIKNLETLRPLLVDALAIHEGKLYSDLSATEKDAVWNTVWTNEALSALPESERTNTRRVLENLLNDPLLAQVSQELEHFAQADANLALQLVQLKNLQKALQSHDAQQIENASQMLRFRQYPDNGWAMGMGWKAGMGMGGVAHSAYMGMNAVGAMSEKAVAIATVADSVGFGILLAMAGAESFKNAHYAKKRLQGMETVYKGQALKVEKTLQEVQKLTDDLANQVSRGSVDASALDETTKVLDRKLKNLNERAKLIRQDMKQKNFDMATSPLLIGTACAGLVGAAAKASAAVSGPVGWSLLGVFGLAQFANSIRAYRQTRKITREFSKLKGDEALCIDSGIRRNFNIYHEQRLSALRFKMGVWGAFTAAAGLGLGATIATGGAAAPLAVTGGLMVGGTVALAASDWRREWRGKTTVSAEDTFHTRGDFLSKPSRRNRLVNNLNGQMSVLATKTGTLVDKILSSNKPGMKNFSQKFNVVKTMRWFAADYHRRALAKVAAKHPEDVKDIHLDTMIRTNIHELNFMEFKVEERTKEVETLKAALDFTSKPDLYPTSHTAQLKEQYEIALLDLARDRKRLGALVDLQDTLDLYSCEMGRLFRDDTREQYNKIRMQYLLAHDLLVDGLTRPQMRELVRCHEQLDRSEENPQYMRANLDGKIYEGKGQAVEKNAKIRTVEFSDSSESAKWLMDQINGKLDKKLNLDKLFARVMYSSLPNRLAYEFNATMNIHMEDMRQRVLQSEVTKKKAPASGRGLSTERGLKVAYTALATSV